MEDALPNLLGHAVEIAKQAGTVLKYYWGALNHITEKEFPGDLVTEADRASEDLIKNLLAARFPFHQILAEESGISSLSSDWCWVVDPLDGTTNYAHQYPMFAVSIALLYQDKPILGVVYNPILDELFQACKGHGATLNGRSIRVSKITSLSRSLLTTGFAYDRREVEDNNYAEFCHFTHLTQGVRRGGSAALDLAYTAAGRFDGYWERGLKPWDMAAGILIVQEAGGMVSDYYLQPIQLESGRILASNGLIHSTMSEELLKVRPLSFIP